MDAYSAFVQMIMVHHHVIRFFSLYFLTPVIHLSPHRIQFSVLMVGRKYGNCSAPRR